MAGGWESLREIGGAGFVIWLPPDFWQRAGGLAQKFGGREKARGNYFYFGLSLIAFCTADIRDSTASFVFSCCTWNDCCSLLGKARWCSRVGEDSPSYIQSTTTTTATFKFVPFQGFPHPQIASLHKANVPEAKLQ